MKRKDRHHLYLLCNISELAALLTASEDIQNFLQRTVEMIARHMGADACSIYLYDEISGDLVLDATIGLNPAAIGKVRMKFGEGLVDFTDLFVQVTNRTRPMADLGRVRLIVSSIS